MSKRMSENERALWMAFLLPPLWPLLLASLMVLAIETIGKKLRTAYRWSLSAARAVLAKVQACR